MNRLSWTVLACLAATLASGVGCQRKEADQEPIAKGHGPASKPRGSEETVLYSPTPATADPGPGQQVSVESSAPGLKQVRGPKRSEGPHTGSKKQQADALFDPPTLVRLQIEISPTAVGVLRRTHWEGGQERPEVKATVREGARVYTNVAVHLKGSAGSFRSVDDKPALTLKFDKFVPEQNFHGLHKISLNNSQQDGTYLSEKIARELFIAAGVPVPRAGHATVELNGRPLGLYVLLEGANRQFLKRYFDEPRGNLYDGGFCRDIGSRLVADCGDDPNNHNGLKALRAAVRDGSYAKLEKALDIDRFLTMVALETILGHWDGYSMNKNNWRIYHDLKFNRMVFIPHGLDQLLGKGRDFDPDGIVPQNVQGEVTRAVLATREGDRRYHELLPRICTNIFKADELTARIDEIVARVSAELAETDPQTARAFQKRSSVLKQRIARRADGLNQHFGVPVQAVEFGSKGVLPVGGWKPSMVLSGEPVLKESHDPAGKNILVINAGPSASSSSWRTRVVLGPGKYQFLGRVRVTGVTVEDGDPRSGAGLRISKAMPRKLTGTSDWKEISYSFNVADRARPVELVCELKATAGEAWFDASSLRLVRSP